MFRSRHYKKQTEHIPRRLKDGRSLSRNGGRHPIMVAMSIQGKFMELDTGSGRSLMSVSQFNSLPNRPSLRSPTVKLQTPGDCRGEQQGTSTVRPRLDGGDTVGLVHNQEGELCTGTQLTRTVATSRDTFKTAKGQ